MAAIGITDLVRVARRFQDPQRIAEERGKCESEVVEWRWASGPMYPHLPHDKHTSEWLNGPPKKHGSLHGLDRAARVRYVRDGDRTLPVEWVYEQFPLYAEGGVFWVFVGSPDKELLAIGWFDLQEGRLRRTLRLTTHIREKLLQWDGDRFVGYEDRSWSQGSVDDLDGAARATMSIDETTSRWFHRYSYAADATLERITEAYFPKDGSLSQPMTTYLHVPKGASLRSLLATAEELLVVEIPKAIAAAGVRERVYALMLQYSGVDTDPGGFPPPLFLPGERLRARLVEKHGRESPEGIWAIPEWDMDADVTRTHCSHQELEDTLQRVFNLTVASVKRTKYGPVRSMYQRVCQRLNALDWSEIVPVTDDFVVLPYDPHQEIDFRKDVKVCLPREKRRLLVQRGYMR